MSRRIKLSLAVSLVVCRFKTPENYILQEKLGKQKRIFKPRISGSNILSIDLIDDQNNQNDR